MYLQVQLSEAAIARLQAFVGSLPSNVSQRSSNIPYILRHLTNHCGIYLHVWRVGLDKDPMVGDLLETLFLSLCEIFYVSCKPKVGVWEIVAPLTDLILESTKTMKVY